MNDHMQKYREEYVHIHIITQKHTLIEEDARMHDVLASHICTDTSLYIHVYNGTGIHAHKETQIYE